ncbi:Unknown protein sequence [Pseudomonas coronafaciens pv. oryzae]|nr:Unknown protein sequence [Pseudomonas coronafaciens pv. oryzae]
MLNQCQRLAGFGVNVTTLKHTVPFVVPHHEIVALIQKGEVGGMVGRLIGLVQDVT